MMQRICGPPAEVLVASGKSGTSTSEDWRSYRGENDVGVIEPQTDVPPPEGFFGGLYRGESANMRVVSTFGV